ncbi:MAG: uracil-DNA glycosylase [Methyloligellaceae bacterium]
MKQISIENSWKQELSEELASPWMTDLLNFLDGEKKAGKTIYPKENEYFRALELTPLSKVRVVILGQDPYHGEGQAHGLSFSVKPGIKAPPSLVNIFKEQERDMQITRPNHGFLEQWAKQGVLLLNSVLTVEHSKAASHQKKGWEKFTDAIIRVVNKQKNPTAFMLWGGYAQKKAAFVDESRHLILKAPHPSPLSAHRGFIGCNHFSMTNNFLKENNFSPITWQLPDLEVGS